jgi:hypothetical protein
MHNRGRETVHVRQSLKYFLHLRDFSYMSWFLLQIEQGYLQISGTVVFQGAPQNTE